MLKLLSLLLVGLLLFTCFCDSADAGPLGIFGSRRGSTSCGQAQVTVACATAEAPALAPLPTGAPVPTTVNVGVGNQGVSVGISVGDRGRCGPVRRLLKKC